MSLLEHESIDTRRWTAWIGAILIALVVAWFGLTGSDSPTMAGPTVNPSGHPETLGAELPAHVQEGIIYGEIDPSNPNVTAEILPVHIVEGIIFGEVEAPTGL